MHISGANTHFLNNAFNFCAGGQRSLCIQRIQSIENEAAIGARQTVQSEGILILLKKSPHLCLFPAPAPSQGFQCQSGAKSRQAKPKRAGLRGESRQQHQRRSDKTTLVVAPVADTTESDRQYGDYVSHAITWNGSSSDEDAQDYAQSAERLVSALQLAQNEGMKVVLVSNTLQGFTPDVYVPMTTAEQIGQLQAKQLVSKLELDKTSSDNPKHIEVLLPYDAANESGSTADATFAQGVFKGIWSVLGPYFKDGKAVSPSGTLTSSSTESDWVSVAFDAAKSERVKSTLAGRLGMDKDTSRHTRIDGIISCNDYVAGYASEELNDLGYTGSAADINPSITISGIVDNITGKKDLKKQSVPDPAQAPESDDGDSDTEDTSDSLDEQNSQWPIITGYGAYHTEYRERQTVHDRFG